VGRFSAITGPIIWAGVTALTIQRWNMEPRVGQGIGVLVLLSMVIVSWLILRPISDAPRVWTAEDRGED
jgi:hypothetical protein